MNNSQEVTQILEDPILDTDDQANQNERLQLELMMYGKLIYDRKMPVLLKINTNQLSEIGKDFIFCIDQTIEPQYIQYIRDKISCIIKRLSPQDRIGITSSGLINLFQNSNDRREQIQRMISSIVIEDNNFNMFNIQQLIQQLNTRQYKNRKTCLLVFSKEKQDYGLFNEASRTKSPFKNTYIFTIIVNQESIKHNKGFPSRRQLKRHTDEVLECMKDRKQSRLQISITVNLEQTYSNNQFNYESQQIALYKFDIQYGHSINKLIFLDVQPPSLGDQVKWLATLNGCSQFQIFHKQASLLYNPLIQYKICQEVELECVKLILSDRIKNITLDNSQSLTDSNDMNFEFIEYESSKQQLLSFVSLNQTCNQDKQQDNDTKYTTSHNYQSCLDEQCLNTNINFYISLNLKSKFQNNEIENTQNISNYSCQSGIPNEYQHSIEHICKRVAQRGLQKKLANDMNSPQWIEEQLICIDDNCVNSIDQGDPSNVRNGYGVIRNDLDQVVYSGYWKDDLFHGNGKLQNYGPQQAQWVYYHGSFEYSKMEGKGIMQFQNGTSYQGGFTQGKANDLDLFIQLYVQSAKEEWDSNYQNLMKLLNDETLLARSHFRNVSNIQDGFGILEDEQGNRIYQGFWKNQQYHNFGIEHNQDVKFQVDGQEHYDWTKYIGIFSYNQVNISMVPNLELDQLSILMELCISVKLIIIGSGDMEKLIHKQMKIFIIIIIEGVIF